MRILSFVLLLTAQISLGFELRTYQVEELESLSWVKSRAQATVALVKDEAFSFQPILKYKNYYNMCQENGFSEEPILSYCSGVLIDSEHILTAAHCLRSHNCREIQVLFDYDSKVSAAEVSTLPTVRRCQSVESLHYNSHGGEPVDIAIMKLDSPVHDRRPVHVSARQPITEQILAIGHPLGLPKKIQLGSTLNRQTQPSHIRFSMSTHNGLSGSPAYNSQGELIGVVVRGGATLEKDSFCTREISCDRESCPWSEVQLIPETLFSPLDQGQ